MINAGRTQERNQAVSSSFASSLTNKIPTKVSAKNTKKRPKEGIPKQKQKVFETEVTQEESKSKDELLVTFFDKRFVDSPSEE